MICEVDGCHVLGEGNGNQYIRQPDGTTVCQAQLECTDCVFTDDMSYSSCNPGSPGDTCKVQNTTKVCTGACYVSKFNCCRTYNPCK